MLLNVLDEMCVKASVQIPNPYSITVLVTALITLQLFSKLLY